VIRCKTMSGARGRQRSRGRGGLRNPGRALLLGLFAGLFSVTAAAAQDFSQGRRLFLEKADCAFCHGWAGDGAGHPQSPGRSANLRETRLGRDQLVTVIQCGLPGTAMPYFDDRAYTDTRCYGLTEAEMGDRMPPLPPSTTLSQRDIEVLANYIVARIIGRGPVTREECFEVQGPRARSCQDYPAR
jgi:mono/diheme cytochrome c family protein